MTSHSGDLQERSDVSASVTSSCGDVTAAALAQRHLNNSNDVIESHDDYVITVVPTQRMNKSNDDESVETSASAAATAADDDDEVEDDDADDVDSPTEQRLMRQLMRRYETAVRPVRNASDTVVVRMGLTLTQIFNMVSAVFHSAFISRRHSAAWIRQEG